MSAVTDSVFKKSEVVRAARATRVKIIVGVILTLIVVVPIALARVLPVPDPDAQNVFLRLAAPGTEGHLFGTDQLGRDLFARILYGGQVSLLIGIMAVVVSGVIGVVLGSLAGYYGGKVDAVISRLIEAQLSLPLLMMLLLVVAIFGSSVPVIAFVIAIANWPEPARLTRAMVLVEREKPYVSAAVVLGLKRFAILIKHVIPNVISQAVVLALLLLAQAVLMESALSFLGAGPQRPFATWGRIISDGQDFIGSAWWIVTIPGIVIAALVIGVNLIGDGLQQGSVGTAFRRLARSVTVMPGRK